MYLYSTDCPDKVRKQFGPKKKCPIVYEFYNENNTLLYVGKTTNFCSRWSTHFRSKKPMLEVVKIVIKTYNDYAEASFVEAQLIAKLQPSWNSQGKDEKASRKKMKPTCEFSLNVLTKQFTEFRKTLGHDTIIAQDVVEDAELNNSFRVQDSNFENKVRAAWFSEYLVPTHGKNSAHLWDAERQDTVCGLVTTGVLKLSNYKVSDKFEGCLICRNCVLSKKKRKK